MISRLDSTQGNRLWSPTPPQVVSTVGPSNPSMHRLVWRRLSAVAALDKEVEKFRVLSVQVTGGDKAGHAHSTEALTAAGSLQNQPAIEKISSNDGVKVGPGLKIPGPYKEFESSPGSFRGFCSCCGSTLIFRAGERSVIPTGALADQLVHSNTIYMKVGTLDKPSMAISGRFEAELWVSNRLPQEWGLNLGAPSETAGITLYERDGRQW
jgi:hypothetical protein